MTKIFLILFSVLICTCGRQNTKLEPAMIPAAYERMYLAPIVSEAELETLDGWPKDAASQQVLVNYIQRIRDNLNSEFIRREKLGYYEMVDDTSNLLTMRISLTLQKASIEDDTLRIPVKLSVERLPDGQKFIYSLQASSTVSRKANRFHYLGALLYNYTKQFPYRELVSFFYPHP